MHVCSVCLLSSFSNWCAFLPPQIASLPPHERPELRPLTTDSFWTKTASQSETPLFPSENPSPPSGKTPWFSTQCHSPGALVWQFVPHCTLHVTFYPFSISTGFLKSHSTFISPLLKTAIDPSWRIQFRRLSQGIDRYALSFLRTLSELYFALSAFLMATSLNFWSPRSFVFQTPAIQIQHLPVYDPPRIEFLPLGARYLFCGFLFSLQNAFASMSLPVIFPCPNFAGT